MANDQPTLDPGTGCQTIMSKAECNADCILKEKLRPSLAGLHTNSAFHITPKAYGCVCFRKIIPAYSLNSEPLLCKSRVQKLTVCSCCLFNIGVASIIAFQLALLDLAELALDYGGHGRTCYNQQDSILK